MPGMGSATTPVEVDRALLERLREPWPRQSDRDLLESAAQVQLGREAIHEVQARSALADEDSIALGVKAVHQARRMGSRDDVRDAGGVRRSGSA
jgi:hypothetical protein